MNNSYSRVTITLPQALLEAADAEARRLNRPRSWVIAESIRATLAAPAREPVGGAEAPAPSPEAAVRASEAAVLASRGVRRQQPSVAAFRTIAAWQAWKAKRAAE